MTIHSPLQGVAIPELGHAAGFALWGFRACAIGHERCCVLVRGYENEMGASAPEALGALKVLVQVLGIEGRRKIDLGLPGRLHATADELSIIAALSAAQGGSDSLLDAHLSWLLAGRPLPAARAAAKAIGTAFTEAAMIIRAPDIAISAPPVMDTEHLYVSPAWGRA